MIQLRFTDAEGNILCDKKVERFPSQIGRTNENDIVVNHPGISRKHAMLVLENGRFIIRDMGSANGMRFGGKKVSEIDCTEATEFKIGKIVVKAIPLFVASQHSIASNVRDDSIPFDFPEPENSSTSHSIPKIESPTPPVVEVPKALPNHAGAAIKPAAPEQIQTFKPLSAATPNLAPSNPLGNANHVPQIYPQSSQQDIQFQEIEIEPKVIAKQDRKTKRSTPQLSLFGNSLRLTSYFSDFYTGSILVWAANFLLGTIYCSFDAPITTSIGYGLSYAFLIFCIAVVAASPFMLISKVHTNQYNTKPMIQIAYLAGSFTLNLYFFSQLISYNYFSPAAGVVIAQIIIGIGLYDFLVGLCGVFVDRASRRQLILTCLFLGSIYPTAFLANYFYRKSQLTGYAFEGTIKPYFRTVSATETPVDDLLKDLDQSFELVDSAREQRDSE